MRLLGKLKVYLRLFYKAEYLLYTRERRGYLGLSLQELLRLGLVGPELGAGGLLLYLLEFLLLGILVKESSGGRRTSP